MDTKQLLIELDAEITRLQTVRNLLVGGVVGNGRVELVLKRSHMSAEGRKRIAEAQRKRWARAKKAAK